MDYTLMVNAKNSILNDLVDMFMLGYNESLPLDVLFLKARDIGKKADSHMFKATNNINAYQGLIFNLGLVLVNLGKQIKDNLSLDDVYNNIKLMRFVKQKENEANEKLAEEYKAISSFIKNIARDNETPVKHDTHEQKRIREELKYLGYVVYEDTFTKGENVDTMYEFITDIIIDINKAKKEIQKVVMLSLKNILLLNFAKQWKM
jgi:triphosphoribosyl-dephospho-CoA synthetase